ncbi:MAG: tannase/feruloyl esterase family alpha/beta hydrolase [Anaerolineae bacterium]
MFTKKKFIRSITLLLAGLFGMSLLAVYGASAAALTTTGTALTPADGVVPPNETAAGVITTTTTITPVTTAEAAPAEDIPPFMRMQQVPGPCGDISRQNFAGIPGAPTAIASTAIVSATAQSPEYCKVTGVIAPQIQFELDLPTTDWNGRYLQVGCGGYCGNVNSSEECVLALGRNYAVGFDNSGHVGAGFGDGSAFWALNEPGLRADFGYLSEHKMSLAAKAIIDAFYGKSVEYAYFQACSNGGRQALQLAQRWPTDFNGIIAGAPAAFQAPLNGLYHAWNAMIDLDDQGNPILTTDKLPLIHKAVLAQCGQQGWHGRTLPDRSPRL